MCVVGGLGIETRQVIVPQPEGTHEWGVRNRILKYTTNMAFALNLRKITKNPSFAAVRDSFSPLHPRLTQFTVRWLLTKPN
jgi:hypothetical protein